MSIELAFTSEFAGFRLRIDEAVSASSIGITGDSGSGKTMLLDTIAGDRPAQSGYFRVGNSVLLDTELQVDRRREPGEVCYIRQCADCLDAALTVQHSLHVARSNCNKDYNTEDTKRVIKELGISPLLGIRGATLSSGQKRLVSLACKLVCRPTVLLFDEPLVSTDNKRFSYIPYLMFAVDEFKVPLIFVSHNMFEIAALGSWYVRLIDGRVSESGPI